MSESQASLDDIFSGNASAPPQAEPPEAETPETAPPETPEDAVTETEPKPESEEPQGEPPAKDETPQESDHEKGLRVTLTEERSKRQAAEYERKLLEQKLEMLQSQRKQPEEKPLTADDLLDDPQKALERIQATIDARVSKVEADVQNRLWSALEASERAAHSDFDEKAEAFRAAAAENPALIDRAKAAVNPAQFIYQQGADALLIKEYGSLSNLIKSIDEKAEAKAQKIAEEKIKSLPQVPESDSGKRSLSKGEPTTVHKSLEEIFGR